MKTCIECKQNLDISKFEKHSSARDGRRNQCHECRYSIRINNNPNRLEKQKSWSLKYRRGISMEEYTKILKSQNYVCAICKGSVSHSRRRLPVDHDHMTGLVRGILCDPCNLMLGFSKDNIQILESAIKYLKNNMASLKS